jgi:hypothetical protein
MATENKGVMVYLPPELETLLEKYCIDRNITRKTRDGHVFASLGTGIVQYLKSQLLGVESNSNIRSSTSLTEADVLELIRENNTSNLPKADVLELIRENNTSNLPSEILTREEVERLITTNCDFSANAEGGAKLIEQLVKAQIEPLAVSLTELETHTQNQFKAVREEINALSGRSVEPTDSIAIPTNTPAKPKPVRDNEPEWVTTENRRFYTKLVNDSELLSKVAEVIPQYPKDNSALAAALVKVGLSKNDSSPHDSEAISRIKKVVECLNGENH